MNLFKVQKYKMWHKRSVKPELDFKKNIPDCSDEQLIEILKLRKHYQPEAAKLAVQEAIRRKIIYSEQDLMAEEFRCEELHFSFFPRIKRQENRVKIRRSIARSLVLCGVLPLVFGFMEIKAEKLPEGLLILLFGVFWMISSAQLVKAYHQLFVKSLMIGAVTALVFISYHILSMSSFSLMDIFLLLAITGFIFYGLLFLQKMHQK